MVVQLLILLKTTETKTSFINNPKKIKFNFQIIQMEVSDLKQSNPSTDQKKRGAS